MTAKVLPRRSIRPAAMWQRILCALLADALVLTSFPPPHLWAQPPTASSSQGRQTSLTLSTLDLSSLAVPEQLGRVVETWQPADQPPTSLVIQIQDVHAHPQAQAGLSELIGYLRGRLGVSLVALEGAEGAVDTTIFSDFPDQRLNAKLAALFLSHGLFTGAEHYAVTRPHTVTLWGVDDQATYLEHLEAYRRVAADAPRARAALTAIREILGPLRLARYPEALRPLFRWRDAYAQGDDAAFERYLRELHRLATRTRVDLAVYPHVRAAIEAYELYPTLDMRRVEADRDRLVQVLRPRLSGEEQRQLAALADEAAAQTTPSSRYDQELARLARAHGLLRERTARSGARASQMTWLLSMADWLAQRRAQSNEFVTLRRYLDYLAVSEHVRSGALLEELDWLEEAIERALLITYEERAISRLIRQFDVLGDLLQVQLSPHGLRRYHQHRSTLTTEHLWSALETATRERAPVTKEALQQLVDALPAHERFYELALRRDEALVRNTLRKLSEEPFKAAILIAGGFHTSGLTERFKQHHVAYAVIAPSVEGELDEARYHERLLRRLPNAETLWQDAQAMVLEPTYPRAQVELPDRAQPPIDGAPARQKTPVTLDAYEAKVYLWTSFWIAKAAAAARVTAAQVWERIVQAVPRITGFLWPSTSDSVFALQPRGVPLEIVFTEGQDYRPRFVRRDRPTSELAKVLIPTPLRPKDATGHPIDSVTVDAATVGEALEQLTRQHPNLRKSLYTDEGKLRGFIAVAINDTFIHTEAGWEQRALGPGDVLSIVPSIAGGSDAGEADQSEVGPDTSGAVSVADTEAEREARFQRIGAHLKEGFLFKYGALPPEHPVSVYVREALEEALGDEAREIHILVAPEWNDVNAVALPDGTIIVSAKLLDFLQYREELKAVLAHEAIHIRQKHSQARDQVLEAARGTGTVQAYLTVVGIARAQEYEADLRWMVQELAKRNVNPLGLVTFFERVEEYEQKYGRSSAPDVAHGRLEDRALNVESIFYFLDLASLSHDLDPIPLSVKEQLQSSRGKDRSLFAVEVPEGFEGDQYEAIQDRRLELAEELPVTQLGMALKAILPLIDFRKDDDRQQTHRAIAETLDGRVHDELFPAADWPEPKRQHLARALYYELHAGIPYLFADPIPVRRLGWRQERDTGLLSKPGDVELLIDLLGSTPWRSVPGLLLTVDPTKLSERIFGFVIEREQLNLHPTQEAIHRYVTLAGQWAKVLEECYRARGLRTIHASDTFSELMVVLIQALSADAHRSFRQLAEGEASRTEFGSGWVDAVRRHYPSAYPEAVWQAHERLFQRTAFRRAFRVSDFKDVLDEMHQAVSGQSPATIMAFFSHVSEISQSFSGRMVLERGRELTYQEAAFEARLRLKNYCLFRLFERALETWEEFGTLPESTRSAWRFVGFCHLVYGGWISPINPDYPLSLALDRRGRFVLSEASGDYLGEPQDFFNSPMDYAEHSALPEEEEEAPERVIDPADRRYLNTLLTSVESWLEPRRTTDQVAELYRWMGLQELLEPAKRAKTRIPQRIFVRVLAKHLSQFALWTDVFRELEALEQRGVPVTALITEHREAFGLMLNRLWSTLPADPTAEELEQITRAVQFVRDPFLRLQLQAYSYAKRWPTLDFAHKLDELFSNSTGLFDLRKFNELIEHEARTEAELHEALRRLKREFDSLMAKGTRELGVAALLSMWPVSRQLSHDLLTALFETHRGDAQLKRVLFEAIQVQAGRPFDELQTDRELLEGIERRVRLAEEAEDWLFRMDDSAKYLLLRRLLTGEDGLLSVRATRPAFLHALVDRTVQSGNDTDLMKTIREVIEALGAVESWKSVYFALQPLLVDRLGIPPERLSGWPPILTESLGSEEAPLIRQVSGRGDKTFEALADAVQGYEGQPWRHERELSQYSEELLRAELIRRGTVAGRIGKEPLSPLAFIIEFAEHSALGARFLQLLPQFVDLPEEEQDQFSRVFDQLHGQSKLAALALLEREWPDFWKEMARLEERVGGGSLMTVYRVTTAQGEQEVVKVLNPNLEFLLEQHVRFIDELLQELGKRYGPTYEVARLVLEDVKAWIQRDVNFQNFLEKDRVFREANDGFTAQGFRYRMYVPRSRGSANRYFMREEYVEGENLTQWEALERQGHDMKQIVSLIVKNYVGQLRRRYAHSDVHVGNFRVTPDGRIAILDRNFFLELNPDVQEVVNTLLNPMAMVALPPEQFIERLTKVSERPASEAQRDALVRSWEMARAEIIKGNWRSISRFLIDLRAHGIKVPLEVTLVFKNLNSLQSMARRAGFANLVQAYLYLPTPMERPDRVASPRTGPQQLLLPLWRSVFGDRVDNRWFAGTVIPFLEWLAMPGLALGLEWLAPGLGTLATSLVAGGVFALMHGPPKAVAHWRIWPAWFRREPQSWGQLFGRFVAASALYFVALHGLPETWQPALHTLTTSLNVLPVGFGWLGPLTRFLLTTSWGLGLLGHGLYNLGMPWKGLWLSTVSRADGRVRLWTDERSAVGRTPSSGGRASESQSLLSSVVTRWSKVRTWVLISLTSALSSATSAFRDLTSALSSATSAFKDFTSLSIAVSRSSTVVNRPSTAVSRSSSRPSRSVLLPTWSEVPSSFSRTALSPSPNALNSAESFSSSTFVRRASAAAVGFLSGVRGRLMGESMLQPSGQAVKIATIGLGYLGFFAIRGWSMGPGRDLLERAPELVAMNLAPAGWGLLGAVALVALGVLAWEYGGLKRAWAQASRWVKDTWSVRRLGMIWYRVPGFSVEGIKDPVERDVATAVLGLHDAIQRRDRDALETHLTTFERLIDEATQAKRDPPPFLKVLQWKIPVPGGRRFGRGRPTLQQLFAAWLAEDEALRTDDELHLYRARFEAFLESRPVAGGPERPAREAVAPSTLTPAMAASPAAPDAIFFWLARLVGVSQRGAAGIGLGGLVALEMPFLLWLSTIFDPAPLAGVLTLWTGVHVIVQIMTALMGKAQWPTVRAAATQGAVFLPYVLLSIPGFSLSPIVAVAIHLAYDLLQFWPSLWSAPSARPHAVRRFAGVTGSLLLVDWLTKIIAWAVFRESAVTSEGLQGPRAVIWDGVLELLHVSHRSQLQPLFEWALGAAMPDAVWLEGMLLALPAVLAAAVALYATAAFWPVVPRWASALFIAGMLGSLPELVTRFRVIDWLHLAWRGQSTNLADLFAVFGAVSVLISLFRSWRTNAFEEARHRLLHPFQAPPTTPPTETLSDESRGYSGLTDSLEESPYRPVLQRAIDREAEAPSGGVQTVRLQQDGETGALRFISHRVRSERVLRGESTGREFGGASQATIDQLTNAGLSADDLKLLEGVTIFFIEGLDDGVTEELRRRGRAPPLHCYGSHYGITRPHIYLDARLLRNLGELATHLHHEARERQDVLDGLNPGERSTPIQQRAPELQAKIDHLAATSHAWLKAQEFDVLTGLLNTSDSTRRVARDLTMRHLAVLRDLRRLGPIPLTRSWALEIGPEHEESLGLKTVELTLVPADHWLERLLDPQRQRQAVHALLWLRDHAPELFAEFLLDQPPLLVALAQAAVEAQWTVDTLHASLAAWPEGNHLAHPSFFDWAGIQQLFRAAYRATGGVRPGDHELIRQIRKQRWTLLEVLARARAVPFPSRELAWVLGAMQSEHLKWPVVRERIVELLRQVPEADAELVRGILEAGPAVPELRLAELFTESRQLLARLEDPQLLLEALDHPSLAVRSWASRRLSESAMAEPSAPETLMPYRQAIAAQIERQDDRLVRYHLAGTLALLGEEERSTQVLSESWRSGIELDHALIQRLRRPAFLGPLLDVALARSSGHNLDVMRSIAFILQTYHHAYTPPILEAYRQRIPSVGSREAFRAWASRARLGEMVELRGLSAGEMVALVETLADDEVETTLVTSRFGGQRVYFVMRGDAESVSGIPLFSFDDLVILHSHPLGHVPRPAIVSEGDLDIIKGFHDGQQPRGTGLVIEKRPETGELFLAIYDARSGAYSDTDSIPGVTVIRREDDPTAFDAALRRLLGLSSSAAPPAESEDDDPLTWLTHCSVCPVIPGSVRNPTYVAAFDQLIAAAEARVHAGEAEASVLAGTTTTTRQEFVSAGRPTREPADYESGDYVEAVAEWQQEYFQPRIAAAQEANTPFRQRLLAALHELLRDVAELFERQLTFQAVDALIAGGLARDDVKDPRQLRLEDPRRLRAEWADARRELTAALGLESRPAAPAPGEDQPGPAESEGEGHETGGAENTTGSQSLRDAKTGWIRGEAMERLVREAERRVPKFSNLSGRAYIYGSLRSLGFLLPGEDVDLWFVYPNDAPQQEVTEAFLNELHEAARQWYGGSVVQDPGSPGYATLHLPSAGQPEIQVEIQMGAIPADRAVSWGIFGPDKYLSRFLRPTVLGDERLAAGALVTAAYFLDPDTHRQMLEDYFVSDRRHDYHEFLARWEAVASALRTKAASLSEAEWEPLIRVRLDQPIRAPESAARPPEPGSERPGAGPAADVEAERRRAAESIIEAAAAEQAGKPEEADEKINDCSWCPRERPDLLPEFAPSIDRSIHAHVGVVEQAVARGTLAPADAIEQAVSRIATVHPLEQLHPSVLPLLRRFFDAIAAQSAEGSLLLPVVERLWDRVTEAGPPEDGQPVRTLVTDPQDERVMLAEVMSPEPVASLPVHVSAGLPAAPRSHPPQPRPRRPLALLPAPESDGQAAQVRALPFASDTTFTFELEATVKAQLGLSPHERFQREQGKAVLTRLRLTLPDGWALEEYSPNFVEIRTTRGGRSVPYYQNEPDDWRHLMAGLATTQTALPGGLYSVHLHIGRQSATSRSGQLQIDNARLGRVVKGFEAHWRALAGLRFRTPREGIVHLSPIENLTQRKDTTYPGVIIKKSQRHPTMEVRILSGLLDDANHLEPSSLQEDIWWAFTLFDLAVHPEDTVPLAVMGIPVLAGDKPSAKQQEAFLHLMFAHDAEGEAVARRRLEALHDEKPGLDPAQLTAQRRAVEEEFEKVGLQAVYALHEAAEGWDERIVEHLRDPTILHRLAQDLLVAWGGLLVDDQYRQVLGFFPVELHQPLLVAIESLRQVERGPWAEPDYVPPASKVSGWFKDLIEVPTIESLQRADELRTAGRSAQVPPQAAATASSGASDFDDLLAAVPSILTQTFLRRPQPDLTLATLLRNILDQGEELRDILRQPRSIRAEAAGLRSRRPVSAWSAARPLSPSLEALARDVAWLSAAALLTGPTAPDVRPMGETPTWRSTALRILAMLTLILGALAAWALHPAVTDTVAGAVLVVAGLAALVWGVWHQPAAAPPDPSGDRRLETGDRRQEPQGVDAPLAPAAGSASTEREP